MTVIVSLLLVFAGGMSGFMAYKSATNNAMRVSRLTRGGLALPNKVMLIVGTVANHLFVILLCWVSLYIFCAVFFAQDSDVSILLGLAIVMSIVLFIRSMFYTP